MNASKRYIEEEEEEEDEGMGDLVGGCGDAEDEAIGEVGARDDFGEFAKSSHCWKHWTG